jgi:hypothetical protein
VSHPNKKQRAERAALKKLRRQKQNPELIVPAHLVMNVSQLPIDKQSDPEVRRVERKMFLQMQDATYRRKRCVHEGAHDFYHRKAGADTEYSGPIAFYVDGKFDFMTVAIKMTAREGRFTKNSLVAACGYAAGGVAEAILGGSSIEEANYTASGDKERFVKFLHDLTRMSDQKIDECWLDAAKIVKEDLEDPNIRKQVEKAADDFEHWYLTGIRPAA